LGIEGVACDDCVVENGGGLLEECLADGQFAVVLFPAIGAHGQRGSAVVVAECDDGSELAFSAEVLAVDGEAFWQKIAVGGEPLVDGVGERVGVDLVDDVVEGVVAGELEKPAFLVAAGEADGGALVLVERTAFGPHGLDVGGTAEQAVGDHP